MGLGQKKYLTSAYGYVIFYRVNNTKLIEADGNHPQKIEKISKKTVDIHIIIC